MLHRLTELLFPRKCVFCRKLLKTDETDLCAHGNVRIHIGGDVLEDDVSLSAAALHLLRSVTEDHDPDVLAKLFPKPF